MDIVSGVVVVNVVRGEIYEVVHLLLYQRSRVLSGKDLIYFSERFAHVQETVLEYVGCFTLLSSQKDVLLYVGVRLTCWLSRETGCIVH